MDKIRIVGGIPLRGTVCIGGAKNATLPLMAASLLTDQKLILNNVPDLADITSMTTLLSHLGCDVAQQGISGHGASTVFHTANLRSTTAPYDLVRKMRASVLVLGPLVARAGEAFVSLPGGCAIGTRPVDLHIKALSELGAEITLEDGYIHARAPRGLTGATITFPTITVTGTENIMMAACLAKGETRLVNAAREPEVIDLAHCLNAMGAHITGIGTDTLVIQGVETLHGTQHRIIPDRIETGTYAIAAVITRGALDLVGTSLDLIPTVHPLLSQCGAVLEPIDNGIRVSVRDDDIQGVDVMTEPFPGFPTDLQAQMMALMTTARGASMITETIFENRFMHVPELQRMGANITVHNASAMIRGHGHMTGAQVMATDLRASVSLVLAGLAAQGETFVNRVYHLDRGYEQVEAKLAGCGAHIERIKGNTQDAEGQRAA